MGIQALPTQKQEVQVLTTHFQFRGQLESIGPAGNYLNNPSRQSLSLYDAQITPLASNSPLKAFSRPHVILLKSQIVFLYFPAKEVRETVPTFPRRELLMSYTPIAVCRGYFHMPAEAKLTDFLSVVPSELIPITETHLFPFAELPAPFPKEPELLLVGRTFLQFYHPM
ncbi:MAG TPA: hypothetical protein ENN19_10975 [Chloroflexi bacterium]|nr:hypothetical protein [Chloroflexota bacterium]